MLPTPIRVLAAFASLAWPAIPAWAQAPPAPKLVAETEARTPAEEKAGFRLPPGFVIELVASEPEINKPMNLAFDDRGRLWVTSTVEYPYPVTDGRRPRDRVVILDDFADDGRARKVSTFADGLHIPIGVLPMGRGDSALVHSIPDILRLSDTDGDGKADKTEVAYEKYGFRDTHGMTNAFTWGFDGWIYACHGFNNDSTVQGSDRRPITMQSGNVYRMKPDGSHADYYSHGQVNPFGLAFDPLGNLYSCDCHSKPIYQLLRGAYYPSFGKPDDGLGFGPTMIDHDHGSTGIGGISFYAADHFPPDYRGTIFIGNVVTSRINHDKIEYAGSSPKAIEQPDFVVSDDPWFRPVDIELGPDGALYVADFYNRIIGHYEVPLTHPGRDRERGRIWRIRYAGEGQAPPKMPRPDWSKASVAELVEDLGHPNLVVRTKATNQLVERGGQEVIEALSAPIAAEAPAMRAVHALWAKHRLGALDDAALRAATLSPREEVRVHAFRVLADRAAARGEDLELMHTGLDDTSPLVRRAAIEALARHPNSRSIQALVDQVAEADPKDTHLAHVARMALRDQLSSPGAWLAAKRAGRTDPHRAILLNVALGVPTAESARFLASYLPAFFETPVPGGAAKFLRHAERHGGEAVEPELARFLRSRQDQFRNAVGLFKAVQQGAQERGASPGEEIVDVAGVVAAAALASDKPEDVRAGIELAGAYKLEPARDRLAALADDGKGDAGLRSAALAAWAGLDPAKAVARLTQALRDPAEPMPIREQAAQLLAGGGRPEGRSALVEALATSPSQLQAAIAAGLSGSRPGLEALLDAVAAGKVSARPLQIPAVALRLAASGIPDVKDRVAKLLKDLPAADAATQTLIDARRAGFADRPGDVARGESVFARTCAACHQMGGKGARVGPQLDGVGVRGADRLLEDVLDPNRNVDQAFRVTNLALKDGRVVSGLLLRQDGQVFVMADAQGQEVRIPEDSVEERTTAQLSPMPANFGEQIPEADFRDLLAYLLSQKPADRP
ncbi:PVC-type heme-binding CxxCH protein [Tundrisphaera sp. TA3]|uniref:PVC-type heme-binding CxxCH protein n=1 Tax=Tundrisphaera sp. TA3 TaxID=3435775 RepID=UPI003EBAF7BF